MAVTQQWIVAAMPLLLPTVQNIGPEASRQLRVWQTRYTQVEEFVH